MIISFLSWFMLWFLSKTYLWYIIIKVYFIWCPFIPTMTCHLYMVNNTLKNKSKKKPFQYILLAHQKIWRHFFQLCKDAMLYLLVLFMFFKFHFCGLKKFPQYSIHYNVIFSQEISLCAKTFKPRKDNFNMF